MQRTVAGAASMTTELDLLADSLDELGIFGRSRHLDGEYVFVEVNLYFDGGYLIYSGVLEILWE